MAMEVGEEDSDSDFEDPPSYLQPGTIRHSMWFNNKRVREVLKENGNVTVLFCFHGGFCTFFNDRDTTVSKARLDKHHEKNPNHKLNRADTIRFVIMAIGERFNGDPEFNLKLFSGGRTWRVRSGGDETKGGRSGGGRAGQAWPGPRPAPPTIAASLRRRGGATTPGRPNPATTMPGVDQHWTTAILARTDTAPASAPPTIPALRPTEQSPHPSTPGRTRQTGGPDTSFLTADRDPRPADQVPRPGTGDSAIHDPATGITAATSVLGRGLAVRPAPAPAPAPRPTGDGKGDAPRPRPPTAAHTDPGPGRWAATTPTWGQAGARPSRARRR